MTQTLSARDVMARLIAFPTVSRDSNLPLIEWVETYLASHGIKAVRVPSPCGDKAALYAHVGPDVEGGVVLSGHTDVVPVDGQDWSSDPFVVEERDGLIYGRGTCDMKGFDALAIWAVVEAKKRGVKRPIQLALSYDEEVGCVGAPVMIDHMVSHAMPRADTVIVGEPSMMKVVTGHKGGTGFHVHFKGFEVHSSIMHEGVSAILEASRLLMWANEMNVVNRAKTPTEMGAMFDPPWTTLHSGKIEGGTAHNITAGDCQMGFDFRVVPGEDLADWEAQFHAKIAEIEAGMKAIRPEAGIEAVPYFVVPPLVPEVDGAAEGLARRLTGDNASHVVSYGTEGGQFQERGYSAVVCGPGDIAQAHQADEFISVAQFEAGNAFMERLLEWCAK